MGLMLSVIISYAGVREALECFYHIRSGMVPEGEPDFRAFVNYYGTLLERQANSPAALWSTQDLGYICLQEDQNGMLKSAAIKYYGDEPHSAAILFSTKISSFGQESIDDTPTQANGDYRTERYTPARTKTIISNTSDSFSVGLRDRSPVSENVSDRGLSANSSERDVRAEGYVDSDEKLTWHYRPKSPVQPTPPEIHFQSFDDESRGVNVYSEEFLRSLDGIKYRPLQRSDPSGRRRSFKKRHSSSSTSSRESRASREEELRMFTSLEEAELERTAAEGAVAGAGFASTPNLTAHSRSRSRSRENSAEGRNEWRADTSTELAAPKPRLPESPKLDSFEEEREENEKVTEEEAEDFWGNSGD